MPNTNSALNKVMLCILIYCSMCNIIILFDIQKQIRLASKVSIGAQFSKWKPTNQQNLSCIYFFAADAFFQCGPLFTDRDCVGDWDGNRLYNKVFLLATDQQLSSYSQHSMIFQRYMICDIPLTLHM